MKPPVRDDRIKLDRAIAVLVRLGEDVTLDDFRTAIMAAALRTNQRLRIIAFYGSVVFLGLTLAALYPQLTCGTATKPFLGFAMGGLGAVTSLFVLLLRLTPDEPFKLADEFDAVGRIIIGCVFSTVLTMALPDSTVGGNGSSSAKAALGLAPFLFGYSTELALRVLERAVQTLIGFFGGDDRRAAPSSRRNARRRTRRTP